MYEIALQFLKEVEKKGYKAYIIGGYPRDKYLNKKSDDIDICTNMTPKELKNNFNVIESFDKFGSVRIRYKDYILEVTTFRKDGIYKDHRRPETVEFVYNLEEDLKRRDFVINTLCIDSSGNYVDIMGAKKDLDNKIIRVVGEIDKKLKEDPLRIIRAIRFSVTLDFKLDKILENYIKDNKDLIKKISDYHICKEYEKIKEKDKQIEFEKILKNLTK